MNAAQDPEPQWLPGGVVAVPGFQAGGVHAGIKRKRKDVSLIVAPRRCAAAAVFTTNAVQAAPLQVCREHLRDGRAQAIVATSGIANACTGPEGVIDARNMAEAAASVLGIPASDVLVASTGVIGPRLPMQRLLPGIHLAKERLGRDVTDGIAAAEGIMTTDTVPKLAACRVTAGDRVVTIGGVAKGSGMIHPDMATMLSFLVTDAHLEPGPLADVLRDTVGSTFNMVTVDGDTSPNDMVILLASGEAGGPPLQPDGPGWQAFRNALESVCLSLAHQIVRDGEGANMRFGVLVQGATHTHDARRAARAVASSNLVKAAVYGRDANWGRVIVAAGASGAAMNLEQTSLFLCFGEETIPLFVKGKPVPVNEEQASDWLGRDGVMFRLDLGTGGDGTATAWGCDLTEEYVRINSSYRS